MKNLYETHPLMIDSGTFWRCDHGSTGYYACIPCGKKHPGEFIAHLELLKDDNELKERIIWSEKEV